MSEWCKVKFGDVVSFPPKCKLVKGEVYPYVELADVDIGFKYVYSSGSKEYGGSGSKFENGDTLFARITPSLENGKIAQIKNLDKTGFGSGEFFIFRGKDGVTDSDFIYYLSQTQAFKDNAINSMVGASGRQRADNKFVAKTEISLPPLPTQKKIAKILSNYDDLIENNLKRIKLLEESARLTYEEWFLRFRIDGKKLEIDPESGLPLGWERVKVNSLLSYYIGGGWGEESISDDFSDEAYVIRGTDIDDIPYGKLEGSPLRYHKASNLASRKLQNKDIIFEVSGGSKTEGVAKTLLITDSLLDQFNNDVMCASFCKLVRPKEQHLGNMLYLSFKYLRRSKSTEVFEVKSASSIINYNWEAFIKHQVLIMPSNDILSNFDKKVDALINEIYNLGHQNQLLKEARDMLLPRLMTGMIDTDDMDVAV